jgi:hypothetical protein
MLRSEFSQLNTNNLNDERPVIELFGGNNANALDSSILTLNRTTKKAPVENNNETLSLTNRIKQSANFNNIKTKFKDSCNYFQKTVKFTFTLLRIFTFIILIIFFLLLFIFQDEHFIHNIFENIKIENSKILFKIL